MVFWYCPVGDVNGSRWIGALNCIASLCPKSHVPNYQSHRSLTCRLRAIGRTFFVIWNKGGQFSDIFQKSVTLSGAMVCLPFIAHHIRFAFLKWKCLLGMFMTCCWIAMRIGLAVVVCSLRPLVKMLYFDSFISVFSFNTKWFTRNYKHKSARISEYLFALWTSCVKPINHVLQHDLRMIQRNLWRLYS